MRNKFYKGEIWHIFNKSIANFGIFNDLNNSHKFVDTFSYYNNKLLIKSFSQFLRTNSKYKSPNIIYLKDDSYCKVLSYCIMPDHYHFLLKILEDSSLSKFINNVENSFTRYFNIKFDRKGPLWQSAFKSVEIGSNEQLLHVSRYIHLNPTTSNLVDKPEDWKFSSYRDFITDKRILKKFMKEISIDNIKSYKQFVENNIEYQRELKRIKKLTLE